MAIRLERTIWPVGHGAFYTEQFKDGDNVLFTAVYDCGSEQIKMRNECIEAIFPKDKKTDIDALFISHFHNDHVNGLQELLSRTNIKRLYVPQLKDDYMLYTLCTLSSASALVRRNSIEFLNTIYEDSRTGGIDEIYEVPAITKDEADRIDSSESDMDITNRRYHKVATTISVANVPEWIYIPCNLFEGKQELIEAFKNDGTYITNGEIDIQKILSDLKSDHWKCVQEIYKMAFPKGHNEYSMTVFSGIKEKLEKEYVSRTDMPYSKYYIHRPYSWELNCLYTGDFEPKNGNVRALSTYYRNRENAWARVEIIQVPHHGSKDNHDDSMFEHARMAFVSAATNDKYGHPSLVTLRKIIQAGCYPFVVLNTKNDLIVLNYHIV